MAEPEGSGDDSELSDLLDRWKTPVAAALGLLVVVVFIVFTQRGTDAPSGNLPEAAPVVSTTQPTTTTTTTSIPATPTSQTTTTLWLGAGTLLVRTRAVCSALNPSGIRSSDEWVDALLVESPPRPPVLKVDAWFSGIPHEAARFRNEQNVELVAILDSILADLGHALDSVDNAFVALRNEDAARWKHQVDLAERHCTHAIVTLERIVSTLYAE